MLTWDSNKGFTVNTIDLKESVKPNLIARRLVHCHAVIVREVETNRVWLAHVSPAEISGGYNDPYSAIAMTAKGADPAYVQFAEKAFSHHNSNCPHGEIDVVVADVYHTFNEDKFRKFVSAQCTIRNLSVIDNDDPSLFNGHDVYYNTKNDTLYLKSNDSKHVIIQHNNVFQRKEMTYTPK